MPTIRTGNQEWDQNLTTLGSALFPDPSKAAHAYYYGAEARKAQIESNKLIDQGNWRSRYGQMTQGGPQPAPPTYMQPDFGAPILAPASNLPMTGGQPSLGAVAAGMTPQQAADAIPAAVAPYTQGTPAPVGPPAPGLPAAPQTTTSNGGVPQNDPVSGVLHPASINTSGVAVQAPPAAHNGSPAPVPPGMTLPGLMAMSAAGSLAGLDAASVAHGGQTLAYELLSRKIITPNQYDQMLAGTGQAAPLVADINAASSLATTNVTQAGETARNAARIAGENLRNQVTDTGATTRTGMATTFVPDPDPARAARGEGSFVPLVQQQGPGGYRGTNPAAVTELVKPQIVQPEGPMGPTYSETTGQAQANRSRLSDTVTGQAAANSAYKIGQYYHPDRPTIILDRTLAQAQAEGLRAATSEDVAKAAAGTAVVNAPTPEAAATAAARKEQAYPPTTRAAPKTAVEDADEQNANQVLIDQTLDQLFPADPTRQRATDRLSGAASPALGPVLRDLSNQYRAAGPTKGDRIASTQAAVKQLVEEGYIIPGQTRDKPTSRSVRDSKTGLVTQTPHFQIELYDPKTLKPYGPEQAPPRPIARLPVSSAVAPGAPAATPAKTPPPGTVLGPANGVPDGRTGTDKETGAKFIVRGGNYVVQ